MTNFDVALREAPLDEGLTRVDVLDLLDMISDRNVIPIEIQAEYSAAMGFISLEAAEQMRYDYTALEKEVREVLEDIEKERPDCTYRMAGRTVWISRDEEDEIYLKLDNGTYMKLYWSGSEPCEDTSAGVIGIELYDSDLNEYDGGELDCKEADKTLIDCIQDCLAFFDIEGVSYERVSAFD